MSNVAALFTGCPYCEWGRLMGPPVNGVGGAWSLTREREKHVITMHGQHAQDALMANEYGGVLAFEDPHTNYDPLTFLLPKGTWFQVMATCRRYNWYALGEGPKLDPATKSVKQSYTEHECRVVRFGGCQIITWTTRPPEKLQLKLHVLKGYEYQPLAPPTKDSDAVTVGQVMQQAWERRQWEAVAARQSATASTNQEDTVNEEATPDPTPIPPREVVQSYVWAVQDMTSELARLMGSAGPERHEHYSWAITQLVSARDALKDLRAEL